MIDWRQELIALRAELTAEFDALTDKDRGAANAVDVAYGLRLLQMRARIDDKLMRPWFEEEQ